MHRSQNSRWHRERRRRKRMSHARIRRRVRRLVRLSFVNTHFASKGDEVIFLPFAFELAHVLGFLHVEGALNKRIVNLIRSERVA